MNTQAKINPNTIDPVDLAKAQKAISKAKLTFMTESNTTFWSALLATLKVVYVPPGDMQIPTAATEGIHLFLNVGFVLKQSTKKLLGLLLHEVMHVVYEHPQRMDEFGLEGKRWNIAGDFYINDKIIRKHYELPEGGLYDPKYRNMSSMEIYHDIDPNNFPDFNPDVMAAPPGMDPKEHKERVTNNIVKAVTQARMANAHGSIPSDLLRKLDDILNPILPWNVVLQNHLSAYAKEDFSWKRPNRRYFPDYYLPSMYSESLDQITVAIDTSGSISDEDMSAFMAEIRYIWDVMKPKRMRLITFDTCIHENILKNEGETIDDLSISGGGGTDVEDVIKLVQEDAPEVTIIFTDGEFAAPDARTEVPTDLFWIIKNERATIEFPFGTTIKYTS